MLAPVQYVHERMAEANEAGTLNSREFWDPVAAMKYMESQFEPKEARPEGHDDAKSVAESEASSKAPASKPGRKPRAKASSAAAEVKPPGEAEEPKPKRGRGRTKKTAASGS